MRGTARHPYSADKAEVEAELREALARLGHRRLRLPPLHRRRPAGAAAARAGAAAERSGRSCRGRCAGRSAGRPRCARCCPTPACPSSSSTTTTSPPRSARRCSATASPASTTSPGPGELTVSDLAHELGWHSVPAPQLAVGVAAEAVAPVPALPAGRGGLDRDRAPAGPDGHLAGAPQAALDAPPRRPRDAARNDRRGARQVAPLGGRAYTWWRCPTPSSSDSTFTLYRRGIELLEEADFEQATEPLEAAARRAPEKSSVREALGRAYFRCGRFAAAVGRVRGRRRHPPGQRLRPLLPRPRAGQDRRDRARPPPPGARRQPAPRAARLPLLPRPARHLSRLLQRPATRRPTLRLLK